MAKVPCASLALIAEGPLGRVVGIGSIVGQIRVAAANAERASQDQRGCSRFANGVKNVRAAMGVAAESGFNVVMDSGALKFEGRYHGGQAGGAKVPIYVFKRDQYRAYGGFITYGDRKCFAVVVVDEAKKQDKADDAILARAAKALGSLISDAEKNPLKPTQKWPVL